MDNHSDCSNGRTEDVRPQQGQDRGQEQGRAVAARTGGQKQQHRHATAVNLIDYRMRYKLGVDVYKTVTLISVQYVA